MSFKASKETHDNLFAVAALRQLNMGEQVSVSSLIREAVEQMIAKELFHDTK